MPILTTNYNQLYFVRQEKIIIVCIIIIQFYFPENLPRAYE